ncbi:MAG TPA: DUF3105 domain-containing protein [Acidimicrobiales bacterium]
MRRALSVMLVVAALTAAACGGDDDGGDDADASSGPTTTVPRGEVVTYDGLSANHVDHRVDYAQTPPVGGDHAEVWQTCGFYDRPIVSEAGVHSLEHGAVWITYRPDLPADQIDLIRQYAEQPDTLASPWADGELPAPVVLSAWGAQIQLDGLPDPRADQFITQYRKAMTAPEPNAPCHSGTTFTE